MSTPLTFLFTDLENSTRLWEQYPELMRPTLARHDELIQMAVLQHDGRVVKSTGDGWHIAFESVTDAVAAALEAQQVLTVQSWPVETAPLKVRMGLHTGTSQERDGDYYGPAVNRAARIMSAAHGGQILLSGTTANLVRDELPGDATLLDLGQHHLRSLSHSVHIFQLNHPSLPLDFPQIKSLSAFKHNLPLQLSSFVGRKRELVEIKTLLAQTRLLTLLGPGGTGKTRLALQSAVDLVEEFADGVWFIELAPVVDADELPERIGAVFNLQEQPGRPMLDSLTTYLRHKETLLLFDNVEHLVRESAELAEHLLLNCPALKILVTGRESLFIAGESTMQIPSLSLPMKEKLSPVVVGASEAVMLFVTRAQAVRPDFALNSQNAGAVAELVRRLDGIPLALELAAVRMRMMSIEQILERLNDRFRLLTGGRRTALPRQQTLQALIDWSWNLLEKSEQVTLRRLAVFSGGWTLEAAQAVVKDDRLDDFDIIDTLEQLINKSMVMVDNLPEGGVRYRMLESIRQYAQQQLFEAEEAETVRERHAEYYTTLGEAASRALEGRDMLVWLDRVIREGDNVKAARAWALEMRLDLALRMTAFSTILLRYWIFSPEGREWLKQAVVLARANSKDMSGPEYDKGLASALVTLGAALFQVGENSKARALLEEGIELAKIAGAVKPQAFGMNMLILMLVSTEEFDTARRVAEEALILVRQDELDFLHVMALGAFTSFFVFQNQDEQARTNTEEALRLAKRLRNPWTNAMASHLKGHLEKDRGDWPEAVIFFTKAAQLFEEVRDVEFGHISWSEAGHIKRKLGDYEGATAIYRQTIVGFQEMGNQAAVAHQLECFAMVAAAQGAYTRAAKLLGAAEGLREELHSTRFPYEQVEFDQVLEQLAADMGQSERDEIMAAGKKMDSDRAVMFALEQSVLESVSPSDTSS